MIKLNRDKVYPRNLLVWMLLMASVCLRSKAFAQADSLRQVKQVKIISGKRVGKYTLVPIQQTLSSDFLRLNAVNVADAIKNFSGVNVKDYGGIGGLKTVSVRSMGANHTGVLMDGVASNDTQNGQPDLGKIGLSTVSSIQLINGQPDSLLLPARAYAYASALLIESALPVFDELIHTKFDIGVKGGSFGLLESNIQWQEKISANWSSSVFTNFYTANGKYKFKIEGDGSDHYFTRKNGDIQSYLLNGGLNYRKGLDLFSIKFNYNKSERGLPGAIVFYNDYASQRLWDEQWTVHALYKISLSDQFKILLNSKIYNNFSKYVDPDYLNIQGRLEQRYEQAEYYQSAAVNYKPIANLEFTYAVDGFLNHLSTNLYQYSYPKRLSVLQAFGLKYRLKKIQLAGNLLHTYLHEWVAKGLAAPDKSIFSPTLMASYEPVSEKIIFRAYYKDSYRTPTFNDLYYSRLGNRILKPERAKQYNLGTSFTNYISNGRVKYFSISADAYYNKVSDKIIAIPNKDLFSWTMLNLGEVDIRGVDISLKTELDIHKDLEFLISGNYTFQNAVDITNINDSYYFNQIPYVPKHAFALNASVSYQAVTAAFNQTYSSERYYLSENLPKYRVRGFSVSDLSFSWKTHFKKYPFFTSIEINNLFNTHYAYIRSFPMPGTSLRLTTSVKI